MEPLLEVHVDVGSEVKCVSGWAVDMLKIVLFPMGYDCAEMI